MAGFEKAEDYEIRELIDASIAVVERLQRNTAIMSLYGYIIPVDRILDAIKVLADKE